MSPLTLARVYQRGWLLYMPNLINNYMNQCWCHQSHCCGIGLPANCHHQLQKTWRISLPFVTINQVLTRPVQATWHYQIGPVQIFCGWFYFLQWPKQLKLLQGPLYWGRNDSQVREMSTIIRECHSRSKFSVCSRRLVAISQMWLKTVAHFCYSNRKITTVD